MSERRNRYPCTILPRLTYRMNRTVGRACRLLYIYIYIYIDIIDNAGVRDCSLKENVPRGPCKVEHVSSAVTLAHYPTFFGVCGRSMYTPLCMHPPQCLSLLCPCVFPSRSGMTRSYLRRLRIKLPTKLPCIRYVQLSMSATDNVQCVHNAQS